MIHTGVVLAYIVSCTVAHTLCRRVSRARGTRPIFKGAAMAFSVAYYILGIIYVPNYCIDVVRILVALYAESPWPGKKK